MVVFSNEILKKAESLISKARSLPNIRIHWQTPISIKCPDINIFEKGLSQVDLQPLIDKKKQPALYYFQLPDKSDTISIIQALKCFKEKGERSCPKIDPKRSPYSSFLYCGSVRTNLHGRLIQHLGKGHKSTYALQLLHWACDLKLSIEFHYAWIDKEFVDFTELLESALAEKLNPLVGKIA